MKRKVTVLCTLYAFCHYENRLVLNQYTNRQTLTAKCTEIISAKRNCFSPSLFLFLSLLIRFDSFLAHPSTRIHTQESLTLNLTLCRIHAFDEVPCFTFPKEINYNQSH